MIIVIIMILLFRIYEFVIFFPSGSIFLIIIWTVIRMIIVIDMIILFRIYEFVYYFPSGSIFLISVQAKSGYNFPKKKSFPKFSLREGRSQ